MYGSNWVKLLLHIHNRGEARLNRTNIIKMLEYAGLSYNDVQPKDGSELIYIMNDIETDVSYSIRSKGSTLIIAFRGSDSKQDWNFNLDFCQKTIPYGNLKSKIKVHAGFLRAYKSRNVRRKIFDFITDKVEIIKLTGHSYGAALAVLCAVDLQYNFNQKDYEVVLFGCPRVGNKEFSESYNRRIFKTLRIENRGDIITKLPFAFMGYKHVGSRILIGKSQIFGIPCMEKHSLQEYYSNIWDV